jgi:hypothetical protein
MAQSAPHDERECKMTEVKASEVKAASDAAVAKIARINGTEMADLIGVDPKAFRAFVRRTARKAGQGDALPGSGKRYSFDPNEADLWLSAFQSDVKGGGRSAIAIGDLIPGTDDGASA